VLPAALLILAYNVDFESSKLDKSLGLVQRSGADVVCLEEVTAAFQREFERRFAKVYPHRAFFPARGTWGIAIASKLPLERAERFEQKPHRMPALEARIDSVTIVCLHLFPPVARIDHILARGIAIGEAKVMKAGGSDHYAVAARVVR
jgi:endonuclease/exonuclease/phosphatase (EEP) superfamily protein YafD